MPSVWTSIGGARNRAVRNRSCRSFCVKDKEVIPVSGHHSPRFEVTGFRFGELAYLTDFKTIAPAEERKLYGVEVLVVNALRPQPHDSHFHWTEHWR